MRYEGRGQRAKLVEGVDRHAVCDSEFRFTYESIVGAPSFCVRWWRWSAGGSKH